MFFTKSAPLTDQSESRCPCGLRHISSAGSCSGAPPRPTPAPLPGPLRLPPHPAPRPPSFMPDLCQPLSIRLFPLRRPPALPAEGFPDKEKTLKRCRFRASSHGLLLGFDDLFAIVATTYSANAMRHLGFMTLGTFNQTRSGQFPVSATGITTCFGHFSLRYCHFKYTSSSQNGEFNL